MLAAKSTHPRKEIQMPELNGKIGEVSFIVQITRKETGQVEEYQMIGVVTDGDLEAPHPPPEQEQ